MKFFSAAVAAIFLCAPSIGFAEDEMHHEHIEVTIGTGEKPKVTMKSNLVDGIKFSLDAGSSQYGFVASSEGVTSHGEIDFPPLTRDGKPLPAGIYDFSIQILGGFQDYPLAAKAYGEDASLIDGPDVTIVIPGLPPTIWYRRKVRLPLEGLQEQHF
ncbi:hypothetical protein [Komagataeibacter saccharivorans]|uniref:hypothetical protein n=1 Tax=Komagataeibacter saccharivorans TaxID=265959 RepID=UPI0024A7E7F9|nr:hypothetical protein [Komagataeibacter saccharivorans]